MKIMSLLVGVSALALANQAYAQTATTPAGDTAPAATDAASTNDIVVTGIRQSLERAAQIKQNAPQIVDSIVSEDIGKFPDPTTAAALQRVPGVQVAVGQNNEIQDVKIRGLPDILTTLDGREIFSTTGRIFSLADLPASALARVDVVKSDTADLIEGGIAGIIDLQLQKPFNFHKPTIVASVRGNYGVKSDKLDGQYSGLITDTWHTGIGDIGVLLNGSYAKTHYNHPRTREGVRRSFNATPFNIPGVVLPNVSANNGEYGYYERPEANGSIQWQASDHLQVYLDGLYTGYRSKTGMSLYTSNWFNPGTTVSNVVVDPDECFDALAAANGQIPTTTPGTVQHLCNLKSATFGNVLTQQSTTSDVNRTDNYLAALGFKYEQDGSSLTGDFSYQKSTNIDETLTATVGRRVASWDYTANTGEGAINVVTPGVNTTDGLALAQGLTQNFSKGTGDLYAGRLDATIELDSIFKKMQFGVRYADRKADFQGVLQNTALGVVGTGNALLVANTGLPDDFYGLMPSLSRLNDGQRAIVPSADFLNSDAGREALRAVFHLASGDPAYDPSRRFDAAEKTGAFYAQTQYEVPIGGMTLDGVLGVRPTRTERTISGFSLITVPASGTTPATQRTVPISAHTTDFDVLPNASARLRFGKGLQLRASYSKTIRRPDFTSLNPGLTYTFTNNPNLQNSGSAGNADLRPQKSDNFDASLEYYFRHGFLAVAVYKRNLTDRVITSASLENIDGINYSINRPRNVSSANLKGIEVSGQTFFDFLPGPLSGFGAFGNFTLADTKIGGADPLAGLPLQGVSKYNFNAGLLFEKYGISARGVYTYRSAYYDGDESGSLGIRPIETSHLLNYVGASGRLDGSISYDINKHLRLDVGATNILGARYNGYYERTYLSNQYRYDDTTYSVGLRAQF